MKEISRELWDEIAKAINVHFPEVAEEELRLAGIKIIEPDYLARAREEKGMGDMSTGMVRRFHYKGAIDYYEKHIKQLEEEKESARKKAN